MSIITVVRNGEKHIEQCIGSVLAQTYSPIEHIVIDGASTDGTVALLRRYDNRLAYWLSEPDEGIYDAMNKGSQRARGAYALYLNSDDYLYREDSLATLLQAALRGGEKPLIIAGKITCSWREEIWDWEWPLNEKWIQVYEPAHPASLLATELYKNFPYNPRFAIAADGDLWLRLRQAHLFQVCFVNTIVTVFRLGGACSYPSWREYKAYPEREISRYLALKHFSILRLLKGALITAIKVAARTLLGEDTYYRYFLYGVYRVRSRLLRNEG